MARRGRKTSVNGRVDGGMRSTLGRLVMLGKGNRDGPGKSYEISAGAACGGKLAELT